MINRVIVLLTVTLGLSGPAFTQSLPDDSARWQDVETFLNQDALSPQDTISVFVKNVPQLSGSYRLQANGKVNMPLIGTVLAATHTPAEFAEILEILYEKDYLVNPTITVKRSSARPEGLKDRTVANIIPDTVILPREPSRPQTEKTRITRPDDIPVRSVLSPKPTLTYVDRPAVIYTKPTLTYRDSTLTRN